MTLTDQEKKVVLLGVFIAVIIIAGSLYYYMMFVKPAITRNTKEVETIKKKTKEIQAKLDEMEKFKGNEEKVDAMKKIVESASKRLPSTPDEYQFLQELIDILRMSKVNQSLLKPQAYSAQTQYTEIPYSIKLKARYHEFGTFLNLLEENPNRFMRVKSFKMVNDDNRPSIHPVDISISTFMFNRRAN